jgi:putative SOS response-associated peptidase YedK
MMARLAMARWLIDLRPWLCFGKMVPAKLKRTTVATAASFRDAFKRRHCLVPVSSFFEWPVLEGKKKKIRISMLDGKPFCFAGLWEHWRNPGSEGPPELTTFTIITCDANEDMAKYHNRRPVIVEEQNYQWWLEAGAENPHALLVPYLNGKLKFEPV